MTQLEALAEAKIIAPEIADKLTMDRHHTVGFIYGHVDEFYIWNHADDACEILAHSDRSWEHALAIMKAKLGNDNLWPKDNSPIEDEVEA